MQSAEYIKETTFKGRKSHIFKTTVRGKENYLIVNLQDDGKFYFHSITDSDKVKK